ncbi:glutamate--tRNA ligase [Alphaproteobacteria bacterium]|nr:glutamate--tRNA ligase [Alphaproteobacteria bacterium]
MTLRTRFAPSPTGLLHVGNARAALFCFLFAKAQNGEFMLRYDDTDLARSSDAFSDAIDQDLAWLGLVPDLTARQSERFDRYEEIFTALQEKALVYACYETPDELDRKRKRQLARGMPPVYDRAALALSAEEKQAFEAEGRQPHWRFKLSGELVVWDDLIRGSQKIETSSLSDPVIRRADGTWLYTLPSVVDDLDMEISHVIRGEDHVTNTAAQIELIAAIGGVAPIFAHFSLMLGADGSNLSKRIGSLSLQELRGQGLEAMSLNSLIARLGTADPVEPVQDMPGLIAGFDISRLGRAPARFDTEDVERLNARILHDLSFDAAQPRLAALGAPLDEAFWLGVRGNITRFGDVGDMVQLINGPITPIVDEEDVAFIAAALASLPEAPLTADSWLAWTASLKEQTGRKGRGLFMPLRQVLTGQAHGPEMQQLLPLIGYDRVVARLTGETE